MKALVTGGTGFVGVHLVRALVERGDEVTALVRSPGKTVRWSGLPVRVVRGDLDDAAALEAAVAGQQVVYHVAGLVQAPDETAFLRANRDGTRRLVAAAAQRGVGRFVLVSSMAAAGPAVPGRPLRGDEPARPVTAYGRSKLAAEEVVRAAGLPWTILRPPMVYGPWDTEFLRVFKTARRGWVPVFGDGTQELSAVFAPDLASALVAAAGTEQTVGGTYYACAEQRFTSRAFAQAVGHAVGREVRVVPLPAGPARALLTLTGALARLLGQATLLDRDKANEFLQPAWIGDPEPLTRASGWRAAHDLASGLAATARWYRAAGWL